MDDRPAEETAATRPDPFGPRRPRARSRLDAQRGRRSEAHRALREEIRAGRRPGDRPELQSEPYRRAARQMARRRARRRRTRVVLLLVVFTLGLVVVDLVRGRETEERPVGSSRAPASGGVDAEAVGPQSGPDASAPNVPRHGTGTFASATGTTPVRGRGKRIRYEIRVEKGSGEDAEEFAAVVDATLSDPRGWTAEGKWSFQRVTGGTVDAVVVLATPDTTDRICRAGGLDPQGYTSCRTGNQVVINLARWRLAVPEFKGDLTTYREYVINHEMGHKLGHGHVLCGGKGKPAPVMQQQTLGLAGCRPNAWPYVNGRYLTGHPTSGQ